MKDYDTLIKYSGFALNEAKKKGKNNKKKEKGTRNPQKENKDG